MRTDPSNPVSIDQLRETVQTYFPTLWTAVEAGLSTTAALLLSDTVTCTTLIYVGPPSAGKTTVAMLLDDAKTKYGDLTYRSDKFTAASWVSQTGRLKREDLETVDLLPRVKHKLLLTPEMAPVFQGDPTDLVERFSIITRVLDGQGLMVDAGIHGRRGHEGDYMFAWIGCTTPLSPSAWEIMGNLGNRLTFFDVKRAAMPTVADLVRAHTSDTSYHESLSICRGVVHRFLNDLFARYGGVRGMKWEQTANDPQVVEVIARLAQLVALLRTPFDPQERPQPESAHRLMAVLLNQARGHALIEGREMLAAADIPVIARIALSSIPEGRRAILQAFVRCKGKRLTVSDIEKASEVSRHTAEKRMEEMSWLGFGRLEQQTTGRKTQSLHLAPAWSWVASPAFAPYLSE